MLFARDTVDSDMFKLAPNIGSGDKGEKNPQLNRLVMLKFINHEGNHYDMHSWISVTKVSKCAVCVYSYMFSVVDSYC